MRAERQQHQRADGQPGGQAAAAGQHRAQPRARHDVQRPERRGGQHERHAGQVERVAASAVAAVGQAEYRQSRHGEPYPAGVAPALGQRGRQGERAEELDGHRGAEGQPGERGVEEPVGAREAEPVERDGSPPATAASRAPSAGTRRAA